MMSGIRWDENLLSQYDVRGPRYTSYPGAQMFAPDFGAEQFSQHLQRRASSPEPLGLYVHIPFCSNICYFCACNKIVTRDKNQARIYLEYLKKEISLLSTFAIHREINSLHFGGGTPNFLEAAELTALIFHLSSSFNFSSNDAREFSIEVDPRSVSEDDIRLMAGLGFNRISFGVQDFNESVQKAVNLEQSAEKISALAAQARSSGFKSVNYDLMYGLPQQTEQTFRSTIDETLRQAPDRIALYNYAHLPERFSSQRFIDRMTLPSASEKLHLLCTAGEQLSGNGYRYMGMDHFVRIGSDMDIAAKNGQLHRGFQGYSIQFAPETLGLGISAISSFKNCYSQNYKTLESYYQALDEGQLPTAKGVLLSPDDHIRGQVIQNLICQLYVDKKEIAANFDIEFDHYFSACRHELAKAETDGLLINLPEKLEITELGRLLLRNICMIFDNTVGQSNMIFSKTI